MTDTNSKLVQEIIAGRADGDLEAIAAAITIRMKETLRTFAWRFRLDGVDVGEMTVTLAEWEAIEDAAEIPFVQINWQRARHRRAIGTVLLQTRGGLSAVDAAARMRNLDTAELAGVFTDEVGPAPFDSGGSSST